MFKFGRNNLTCCHYDNGQAAKNETLMKKVTKMARSLEEDISINNDNDVLVSIICAAYNHEKYISDALSSFVSQECSFDFEVLVSDDASTDGTADIIRKFELAYPEIIKPVYYETNQWSQGKAASGSLMEAASGKYIAICEGDDFWIDSKKLEAQIRYLEEHQDCTFCFSNAKYLDAQSGKFIEGSMLPINELDESILCNKCNLSTSDMLQLAFIPTASFVFRKKDWQQRPIFKKGTFMGDRYWQIIMTEFGYAHYFDSDMVAYRVNNPQSAMGRREADSSKAASAQRGYILLNQEFDNYTNGRYHEIIESVQVRYEYSLYMITQDYKALHAKKYARYAKSLSKKSYLGYLIRVYMPAMARLVDRKKLSN